MSNGQIRLPQELLIGQQSQFRMGMEPGDLESPISAMVQTKEGPLLVVKGGATRLEKIATNLLIDHLNHTGECDDRAIQDAVDRAAKLLSCVEKSLINKAAAVVESSDSTLPA